MLGDLLLDVVVTGEKPMERGTDVPGVVRFRVGGSAANTARAFSRLGGRAIFIGSVGRDGLGRRLVAAMRAEGVRVHAVTADLPTGRLAAIVERGGERSFITERGAADALSPADVRAAWLRAVDALHMPAYSLMNRPLADAAERAAGLARDGGALLSLDLASRGPLLAMGRQVAWRRIEGLAPDLILGNRGEAAALSGSAGGAVLLTLAPVVVIKEGHEGCRVLWRQEGDSSVLQLAVATTPIPATDTTGAGDAFAAGFLRVLLEAGGAAARPWGAAVLRRAALAGHRAAAELLRGPRAALPL